jgi:hypothetical protein
MALGRPPIGGRAMTGLERLHRHRAKLRDKKVATPPVTPPDPAAAAAEALARFKAHPSKAGEWLRSNLDGESWRKVVGPPGVPLDDLFPMPYERLVYWAKRGKLDEAKLREVRDAIDRLLANARACSWMTGHEAPGRPGADRGPRRNAERRFPTSQRKLVT